MSSAQRPKRGRKAKKKVGRHRNLNSVISDGNSNHLQMAGMNGCVRERNTYNKRSRVFGAKLKAAESLKD